MLSRREFVLSGLAAGVMTPRTGSGDAADGTPSLLDHILVGINDLDAGVAFFEEHLGVRAIPGGVHPGRGTRNALLSLGPRRYLEIIAPDPAQPEVKHYAKIQQLTTPRLIGWAAHPGNLEDFSKRLREAGVAFDGPYPGSRAKPDGGMLAWSSLMLSDDLAGLLPFFIEWSAGTVHPSEASPSGCRMLRFTAHSPEPEKLAKRLEILGLDMKVEAGSAASLKVLLAGPKGNWTSSS